MAVAVAERHDIEQKLTVAVCALRQDAQHEVALGDAEKGSRNSSVSDAAEAIMVIISGSKVAAELAVEAGAIEAVIHALRLRPNSEVVQKTASSCLGRLAISCGAESQRRAREAGAVETVVSALTGHPNSISVQENAAGAIQDLVQDCPASQLRALHAGGVGAIVLALELHSEIETLQSKAACALAHVVSSNEACRDAASRAGAVDVIIKSLRHHVTSDTVQEHCLQALGHIVRNNIAVEVIMQRTATAEVVLMSLKRYGGNRKIQVAALATLGALVKGNPESQACALDMGAFEVVARLLNTGYDVQIQEQAYDTLGLLTSRNRDSQAQARKHGLMQQVIQRVLSRPEGGETLKAKALSALGSIVAGDNENQRLAGDLGAIQVAMALLKGHPESEVVQESSFRALGLLTAGNIKNQAAARESGALMSVLSILWQPVMNDAVQSSALGALTGFVASSRENTKAAVELGAIEEVLTALKVRAGCDSVDGSNEDDSPCSGVGIEDEPASPKAGRLRKLAREAGLIEAAAAALQQPPKRTKVEGDYRQSAAASRTRILSIIGVLVFEDSQNQLVAGDLGLVQQLISVMNAREKTDEILFKALNTLTNLMTKCAPNQRRAKDFKAEEALFEVERQYRNNSVLLQAVAAAQRALRSGENFVSNAMLETEFAAGHQSHVPIPDVAMRGITLEQFQKLGGFIHDSLAKYDIKDASPESDRMGQSITWDTINMYQAKDSFLLKLTQKNACSYVESVAAGPQPPMWMISHWWGTPLASSLRMLQLQARSRCLHSASSVTYWCCTMANNQHNLCELEEEDVLKSPFARAMLSQCCMGTVLLCDPAVTPLTRIWCVFEAHITQKLRCGMLAGKGDRQFFLDIVAPVACHEEDVVMTMLQDATGGSWQEVSDQVGVYFPLHIAEIGVKVDLFKAKASVEADRIAILNFVANGAASQEPPPNVHPNYEKLNTFVHTVFASAELYRLALEQPEGCVEAAAKLLALRADVNSFVRDGNTALLAAVGADRSVQGVSSARTQHELVSLLLAANADVNEANSHKQTAIQCTRLHKDTRALLLEHGAVPYAQSVQELERKTNARIMKLLTAGFSTEWQAFQGGDAGTKLTGAAQRSLQAVAANVLKRYPWAACRVIIKTSASKRQEALTMDRGLSVRRELESAQCVNDIDICQGSQATLLCISVTLESITSKRTSGCSVRGGSAEQVVSPQNGGPKRPSHNELGKLVLSGRRSSRHRDLDGAVAASPSPVASPSPERAMSSEGSVHSCRARGAVSCIGQCMQTPPHSPAITRRRKAPVFDEQTLVAHSSSAPSLVLKSLNGREEMQHSEKGRFPWSGAMASLGSSTPVRGGRPCSRSFSVSDLKNATTK